MPESSSVVLGLRLGPGVWVSWRKLALWPVRAVQQVGHVVALGHARVSIVVAVVVTGSLVRHSAVNRSNRRASIRRSKRRNGSNFIAVVIFTADIRRVVLGEQLARSRVRDGACAGGVDAGEADVKGESLQGARLDFQDLGIVRPAGFYRDLDVLGGDGGGGQGGRGEEEGLHFGELGVLRRTVAKKKAWFW